MQKVNTYKTEHDKAFEKLEKQARWLKNANREFLSEFNLSPVQFEVLSKLHSAGGIMRPLSSIKETCTYFDDFNLLMLKELESRECIVLEYDSFGVPRQAGISSVGSLLLQDVENHINPKIEKQKAKLSGQEAKLLNLILDKLKTQ